MHFMYNPIVKGIFIFLIVVNGILVGIETDHNIAGWEYISTSFLIIFCLEVFVKLFGTGCVYWQDLWNLLDFVIIALAVVEAIVAATDAVNGDGQSTSVLRLARILRLFRVVGRFQRLAILLEAYLKSLAAVGWVAALMLLFIYMGAVMTTILFGHNTSLLDRTGGYLFWSTVPRSMVALIQIATGDSWESQIGRPLQEESVPGWLFLTCVALVAVGIGFLNLIAAVFVDSLLKTTVEIEQRERQEAEERQGGALNSVAQLFALVDADGSGEVDKAEVGRLLEQIAEPSWEPILEMLNMTVESVKDGLRNIEYVENAEGDLVATYADFEELFRGTDSTATRKQIEQVDKWLSKLSSRIHKLEQHMSEVDASLPSLEDKLDAILSKLKSGG